MNKVTTKEIASFILATADLLDYYDLRDAYIRAMRARAKNEHGVYINDDKLLKYTLSYEDNWKNFVESVIIPKYKDLETFKFFQECNFVGSKIWAIDGDTIKTGSNGEMTISNIAYLLYYVVNGELDKDFARAHKVSEDSGIREKALNFSFTNFGVFGNIEVKKFNNGKIIFKGLNDEQRARLLKVYTVTHL